MKRPVKKLISTLIVVVLILTIPLSSFAANAKTSGMPKVPDVTATKKNYPNDIAKAISENPQDFSSEFIKHGFPAKFDVKTVKAGVKIDSAGQRGWKIFRLENKNGKLSVLDDSKTDWTKAIKNKQAKGSKAAGEYLKGSYLQINKAGYYLITAKYNNPNGVSHSSWAPAKNSVILRVTANTAVITDNDSPKTPNSKSTNKEPIIGAPGDNVDSQYRPDLTGGFHFAVNYLDGIEVWWLGRYNGQKEIKYYTLNFAMYNQVGDPAPCRIQKTNKVSSRRITGPAITGTTLLSPNIAIGYTADCYKVVLETLKLEYMDGTTETVDYWWETTDKQRSW